MNDMTCVDNVFPKPLVSICVPVYNVAPYIEQCARTLFEQTYSPIEYVFVDDASTDDSMNILHQVAADYPCANVQYADNDRNRGLAYTRRRSIEIAKGEYVCCVDSDDWVEKNMVEVLLERALKTGCLMVEAAYCMHRDSLVQIVQPKPVNSFEEVLRDIPCNNIWGKLYHHSVFADSGVFAPEGMDYMEDRYVLTRLRYLISSVELVNDVLYHYRKNRIGSIAEQKGEQHFICMQRFYASLEQWLSDTGLYEHYAETIAQMKVQDKAFLICNSRDISVCKQFADLYQKEEKCYVRTLRRGYRVVLLLVRNRWWSMLRLYRTILSSIYSASSIRL